MHSKMQAKRGKDRLAIVYLNESRRKEKKIEISLPQPLVCE
jgi:hypothetical protein